MAEADGAAAGSCEPRGDQGTSLALIDALKAMACCLIVLHHLAFYGPMADVADDLFPRTFDWLAQHARLAVQVFLVLGGFLAARGLHRSPVGSAGAGVWRDAARRVLQRFIRLALPLWVALVAAVASNALADHWMDHHSIGSPPELWQGLVHLLLLQDLTGHEALSAGIWYVAIDFQLFAALVLMAAASRGCRWSIGPDRVLALLCLTALALSAFSFNRNADWDATGAYFWASYGLGVMLGLKSSRAWMGLALAVVTASLVVDPRSRLLVAGGTAVLLAAWSASEGRWLSKVAPWVTALSRISYAVFLIHFPVSLVVNALWWSFVPAHPWLQLLGVVTAFKLSILLGAVFHHSVEEPLVGSVLRRLNSTRRAAAV